MNYLGHLLLSGKDEHILVGNFLLDHLTLDEQNGLDRRYRPGVLLHRHIDKYTDGHPLFSAHLSKLYPIYGKYASVVLDVFMDYLIASDWNTYSKEPFGAFKQRVYRCLNRHLEQMPKRIHRPVRRMIAGDFIQSYRDWSGLESVYRRLDKRTAFQSDFANKMIFLKQNEHSLNKDFDTFFEEIRDSCIKFLLRSEKQV